MVDSMREGEMIRAKVAVVDVDGDEVDILEELSVMLTPAGDAHEQDYRAVDVPRRDRFGRQERHRGADGA